VSDTSALLRLCRSRCAFCGDLSSRHQGKAVIGKFNPKDASCSVVGCGCPGYREPASEEDVQEVLRLRNRRRGFAPCAHCEQEVSTHKLCTMHPGCLICSGCFVHLTSECPPEPGS